MIFLQILIISFIVCACLMVGFVIYDIVNQNYKHTKLVRILFALIILIASLGFILLFTGGHL